MIKEMLRASYNYYKTMKDMGLKLKLVNPIEIDGKIINTNESFFILSIVVYNDILYVSFSKEKNGKYYFVLNINAIYEKMNEGRIYKTYPPLFRYSYDNKKKKIG